MSNTIRSLVIALLLVTEAGAEPIKLHPANPHYYTFNGQSTILITSAEHYGAVINLDFDYVAYLDALKAYGLNYTRIWPGAVLEMVGEFTQDNTMGPRPDRTIVPWLRSHEPGYVYGGNKFDLDQWNPEFFARLKDFIVKAGERGIVDLIVSAGYYQAVSMFMNTDRLPVNANQEPELKYLSKPLP